MAEVIRLRGDEVYVIFLDGNQNIQTHHIKKFTNENLKKILLAVAIIIAIPLIIALFVKIEYVVEGK